MPPHRGSHLRDALAQCACDIHFADLPPAVVRQAKLLVLDTLGCALGGIAGEPVRAARAIARALGGRPEATIIGSGERTSCTLATFVNGTALRYLDANDYYFGRDPAHASGNIAAILAVGERVAASGAEVLAALVAAYEVQLRLCDHAGEPSLWDRGWHHATNMSYASAAAAAKLLRLDPRRTAEALSIAGTHGNILTESMRGKMATIKATIEAVAAKGGVEAALMAHHGLTGPEAIFEGDFGWARAVAGTVDSTALGAPLTGEFRIMKARIKPFPAFAPAQAMIHAALELHRLHKPDPARIIAIEGRFPDQILRWPTSDDQKALPTNRETADHSPLYLMAVALADGACGPAQFAPARLKDPVLHHLMHSARVVADAALTANYDVATGAAVAIVMDDGVRHEAICPVPPGHPDNRLGLPLMHRKFRDLAEPVMGAAASDRIIDAVDRLERYDDIRDFTCLLAADGVQGP